MLLHWRGRPSTRCARARSPSSSTSGIMRRPSKPWGCRSKRCRRRTASLSSGCWSRWSKSSPRVIASSPSTGSEQRHGTPASSWSDSDGTGLPAVRWLLDDACSVVTLSQMQDWPHVYAHLDMDAFFVGAELLRRPELRGRPVVVATGTDPRARGVVMAASYEAREHGVHSALPLAVAHRRCPQAVLIQRDMAYYLELSGRVMGMLGRYSDRVEVAGLDEAYLDLSDSAAPGACGRRVKHEIRQETGLVCSVGLAPNKLLAKIASDLDKPDGFSVLAREQMLEAVGARPASLLPGVGPKTAERLKAMGIATVAQLAGAEPGSLERAFGPRL